MNFLFTGALSCLLAIALNAFGAHMLKNSLSAYSLEIFQTAADYQLYHGVALILVAMLHRQKLSATLVWSGHCFLVGTVLFSGSLYLLSFTGIKWLGAITPLGGVSFIAGWLLLAIYAREK